MKNNYTKEDIKTLESIEAIRLRPGMYIGSVEEEGVNHILLEIISNVVDEYLNGYCTKCVIEVGDFSKGETVVVTDDGRGIPFGKAKDGSETLVNVFSKLHTGAKFDSEGNTGYNTSGGQNGVGAKATNALSEIFNVSSVREGKNATASFKRGKLISYKEQPFKSSAHGTSIQFRPDPQIFKNGININYDKLKKQLQELAFLSPGLIFELTYKDLPTESILSKNGLVDYIDFLTKGKSTLTSKFYAEAMQERIGVKAAMVYNESFSDSYKLYTNSIPNSSGTHLTGFRTALTQTVNEYARENNLLKEKDSNFTGEDLKEGLVLVLSLIMPDPVFSGQTKDTLTSSEARTLVQRLIAQELKIWFKANPKDIKAIINKALLARTARDKARKAKETVRKANSQKSSRILLPGKLSDCYSKNRSKCELWITEGDSAGGSCKNGRNPEFQAVLPIRGKMINVLKADITKAYANAEIQALFSALGLEVKEKAVLFDKNKIRYGKVIIAADSDVDGRWANEKLFA